MNGFIEASTAAKAGCHVCGAPGLVCASGYTALSRVTSDCKPWPVGGQLGVCAQCDCAQAVLDDRWHEQAGEIYANYTIYHQAQGEEQSVFDAQTGQPMSRSLRLIRRWQAEMRLPERGRLLDIGCGNGGLLRAFGASLPHWSLAGLEVNDRYRSEIERIPSVEGLYTGAPAGVPGLFDLVTLLHALEHIPSPRDFLFNLRPALAPGGLLLIQVPDCGSNPFMFLVADHATHFFSAPLRALVESAGYEVLIGADNWVAKELTIVARRAEHAPSFMTSGGAILPAVARRLDWLAEFSREARDLAVQGAVGIFGTSIAATWLQQELGGKAAFFVDEDPNRVGRTFMGRRILRPGEVQDGSRLILALPFPMAEQVRDRLAVQFPNVQYYVPPALGA